MRWATFNKGIKDQYVRLAYGLADRHATISLPRFLPARSRKYLHSNCSRRIMNDQKTLLQIDGVTKIFPGVRALDNVTFSVVEGEVHGLVGENGAGKSTLMAVASGALTPDAGAVIIDGAVTVSDPQGARALG